MSDAPSEFTVQADPAAQQSKIQAALEKRGGIPKVEEKPEPKAKKAAEPKPEPKRAEKSPEPEPAEPEEEITEAAEEKPEEEKKEPKTSRAKEWTEINRVKGALAKQIREVNRAKEQLTKDRADFSKLQAEMSELNELSKKDKKAFIERVAGGDLRGLFKQALEAPEKTPEQLEKEALKAELDELKAWKKSLEDEREGTKKKTEQESAQSAERATYERHMSIIRGHIDASESLERIKSLPKPLLGSIVAEARGRIISTFEEKGYEPKIFDVLREIEDELFPEQPATSIEGPSERASGAEPTAKLEAKRTPTLKNATATARASAARPPTFEDRLKAAANKLASARRR